MEKDKYLESYGDINVHRLMLDDQPRMLAYRNAIFGNKTKFEGKTVLDVGCGVGVLSVFSAQAGAKKVHAVECSSVAELAKKVVVENNVESIVTVHKCRVEDLVLEEKVDIIVSEWMGFYLVHEGMLPSVMVARDKFLKPEGLMFPSEASIWAAACEVPEHFDYWNDVYGVKMECIGEHDRQLRQEPEVMLVKVENILTVPLLLHYFDLKTVTLEELQELTGRSLQPAVRDGKFQGVCLWFYVSFPPNEEESFSLDTGPAEPATHWKQTVVILPTSDEQAAVTEQDPSTFFEVTLKVNTDNNRLYTMEVNLLDASEVEHDVPCNCFSPKCSIIKTFLASGAARDISDEEAVIEEEEPGS